MNMAENSQELGCSGLGWTVKDQVENIDVTLGHFRKTLDAHKKNRMEIQFELKKLEEITGMQCDKLEGEVNSRIKYLSDSFRNEHANEEKELDYLEIQNTTLTEEHTRLSQLGDNLEAKVGRAETNVGM